MQLALSQSQREWKELAAEWEEASPQAILRWTVERFGERLTLGTGLGPSGIVLIHMLREIIPNPDIFFLDTGLHFEETYALKRRVETQLEVRIRALHPVQSVAEQAAKHGPALWDRDPNHCCYLRKVTPLRNYLADFDGWLTAVRRDQGSTRANLPIVRYVNAYGVVKVCPLATWTREMVWTYLNVHELPFNPLHSRGYSSISCAPCTQPVAPGDGERAGRWMGFAKVECGLHTV
ncbi:MAG: phosphoadenylyl-sulfate reductase [Chloroflexota bacterium]|nr:phosphoadenylyl-sulfate reductase [Chloroflexota bacterium]